MTTGQLIYISPATLTLLGGAVAGFLLGAAAARNPRVRNAVIVAGAALIAAVLLTEGGAGLEAAMTRTLEEVAMVTERFAMGALVGWVLGWYGAGDSTRGRDAL